MKQLITFLSLLFDSGIGYSAINTAKSAISTMISTVTNVNMGSHNLVKRFMKGIFHKRPCLPRYKVTWDVSIVLNHIKTLDNASLPLRQLSKKLCALLALTTGQRCQTLHALEVHNIELTDKCVKLRVDKLLKQSSISHHLNELYVESYPANASLCVVVCLKQYLQSTCQLRSDTDSRLFITTQKPYKGATKTTISKWIRELLRDAGVDISIFKPHSTRSASTSVAAGKVPIDTILRTAGWKSDCVFRRHYQRPITNDSSFSHCVLSQASK